MTDEMYDFMLKHMKQVPKHPMEQPEEIKNDIGPEEAIEIFNELIGVLSKHNVSYQLACRLSLALNEAFMTGAVELMGLDSLTGD